MIKVLYFARIKEALGSAEESLQLSKDITSIDDLKKHLSQRGDVWQQTLIHDKVLIAVNQEVCNGNQKLKTGDEVAFFPPVTGG